MLKFGSEFAWVGDAPAPAAVFDEEAIPEEDDEEQEEEKEQEYFSEGELAGGLDECVFDGDDLPASSTTAPPAPPPPPPPLTAMPQPQQQKPTRWAVRDKKRLFRSRPAAEKSEAPSKPGGRAFRRADTNVVCLRLGTLTDEGQLATGDALFCTSCNASLSHISNPVREEDSGEKGGATWICEFCGTSNTVFLDPQEMPTTDTVDYILEAAPSQNEEDASNLIFCIDTSGSMCCTTEVQGRLNLKGPAAERLRALAALNTEGESQWMPGQNRNVTFISRMLAAQAAVDSQLETLAQTIPGTRVGLVTFANDVSVYGDGNDAPVTIAGDRLDKYDELVALGEKTNLTKPIRETREKLSTQLFDLEEVGATALGPALLVSVAMASRRPASRVVICTDGLANVGLGSIDGIVTAEERSTMERFYENVGTYAKAHGVVVSVLSIRGTDCSLENVGSTAHLSGGDVDVVDPMNLANEFGNILNEKIIATHAAATLFLHKGLVFRNAQDPRTKGNTLVRDIGNITASTEFSFEYAQRPPEDGIDLSGLDQLPFQVQVRFTKMDGMKCIRVVTQGQPITRDRRVAEEAVNVAVIGASAAQRSAELAMEGEYTSARLNLFSNQRMLKRSTKTESQRHQYGRFLQNMKAMDDELADVQEGERDRGLNLSDEEEEAKTSSRGGLLAALGSVFQGGKKKAVRKSARSDSAARIFYGATKARSDDFM